MTGSIRIGQIFFIAKFFRIYSKLYCKASYERITGRIYKEEHKKCDFYLGIRLGFFRLGIKLNYSRGEGYYGLYFYLGFLGVIFTIFRLKNKIRDEDTVKTPDGKVTIPIGGNMA